MSVELVCPKCARSEGLYYGVDIVAHSWRTMDSVEGQFYTSDICIDGVFDDGTVGCGECSWEGVEKDLVEAEPELS